jgi:Ca2+-binding EF-hand superfamily protein
LPSRCPRSAASTSPRARSRSRSELPGGAQARFTFLDVNQDGVLSKYEYDSDVAFETMDRDHNHRLSAAELQAGLGAVEPGSASAADRIVIADLDADGELDDAELRRSTELRFGWLDRNGDGNLDLAEMQAGYGARVRP